MATANTALPLRVTTPTGPFGCDFPNGTVTLQPGVYYGGWNIR